MKAVFWVLVGLTTASPAGPLEAQTGDPMTTTTADGVTIYGEPYFGDLGADAPLILLFHQGGANGRGEYAALAQWLNAEGFRAIAWDQRSGGSRLGSSNRTVDGHSTEPPASYCEVYPDLQAALDYVTDRGLAERVLVWGSSYSGALVFRLAAERPGAVRAVIAFSPASGDPMSGCEARRWVGDIDAAKVVFRPASEMELPGPIEQRQILSDSGVEFHVVENGVHGSSMLLDARTNSDMSATRQLVAEWIARVLR